MGGGLNARWKRRPPFNGRPTLWRAALPLKRRPPVERNTRWCAATGTERANYQLFLTDLCTLLGLPQPDPARGDTQDHAYCFVSFRQGCMNTEGATPVTRTRTAGSWRWT